MALGMDDVRQHAHSTARYTTFCWYCRKQMPDTDIRRVHMVCTMCGYAVDLCDECREVRRCRRCGQGMMMNRLERSHLWMWVRYWAWKTRLWLRT